MASRDFRPYPLLGNAHLQTVLGSLVAGPWPTVAARLRTIPLPDGDHLLAADSVPAMWQPGEPIALIVHGVGGSLNSRYAVRTAAELQARGVRAVRLNLRGGGPGAHLARHTYHAGCSPDVRAAVAVVVRESPSSPVWLVGFSLGGNVVLKLAGEAAVDPVPGLAKVAAVAPPADLEACSRLLQQPRNRGYDRHFARELVALARRRWRLFADEPRVRFPVGLTLRQFDDLYTAPRNGFADVADYYTRAASLPLLPRVTMPTFILTARDDPFIAAEPLERCGLPGCVTLRIEPRGGHLGFIGHGGTPRARWAEVVVCDWLTNG